ncbi:hypothetical protein Scep_026486 [Stephania cephalantha]|uniref:Uncharacterized protein n=1 Tax=Stephania cephalantha TaxID=152367 RepID=A0AAP0ENE2_9MAGN
MAKREKIGKGVVKNTGKESTALIDTSSKEEMEEVEGNEKDSSIGQEFFITFDDEGGNDGQVAQSGEVADQSDNESNEEEGSSTKEGENETMDKQEPRVHVMEQTKESHEEHNLEDQYKQAEEELEVLLQKHFEVGVISIGTTIPEIIELPMGTLQHQVKANEKMKVMAKQLEELKMLVKSSNSLIVQQQQMEEIRNAVELAV